jgi:hypothetical protein
MKVNTPRARQKLLFRCSQARPRMTNGKHYSILEFTVVANFMYATRLLECVWLATALD